MPSVRPELLEGAPPRAKTLRSGSTAEDLPTLLAHDLKTPLAAIAMNLDYAMAELPAGDPRHASLRAALEDCQLSNERAVRLVSDMADALRLASGDRRPLLVDAPLAAILECAVAGVANEAAARGVRVVWASSHDVVRVDAALLERALERLLERALRQTSGGCVVVDQTAEGVTIRAEIPAESRASDRCLATVFAEAVVRAHGGRLAVESTSGSLVYRIKLG